MEKGILNYRVIIEPEKMGKRTVYNAYCPTLGVADCGDTIDEALKNIQGLIKFHIECLLENGEEVPEEKVDQELIATARVSISGDGRHPQVAVG